MDGYYLNNNECLEIPTRKGGKYLEKNNYLSEFETDYQKKLVLENLGILERLNEFNGDKIGYIYEDLENGKFLAFSNKDSYDEYIRTKNKSLIICQWNNELEKGLPIYTKSFADKFPNINPEKYILIPDEEDITQGNVQNKTYDTSINGPLANILFSAIRSLQSEIAKIKNTFKYGMYSYSGTNTAMSTIQTEGIEDEPLWAVEEEDLSLIKEVLLGQFHEFVPSENVTVYEENSLFVNESGASYFFTEQVEDPKIFIYLTTSKPNVTINLQGGSELQINLLDLNIPIVEQYDILFIISRTQKIGENYKGNNFIWISINNRITDKTILEGYYNLNSVQTNIFELSDRYNLKSVQFNDTYINKFKIYSKFQDFSKQIIPSKPSEDDYKYKVAHITIRSVNTYSTLESIKDQLPENELIFVEDSKRLYIKNRYKLTPIGGGSNITPSDEGMTREETIALLNEIGITVDDTSLSEITFIHQETGTKFNLSVDAEGNLRTSKIDDDTLEKRIKESFGESATSVGDSYDIRGFVGRLGLAYHNVTKSENEDNYKQTDDIKLYSDRVKIGSFYAPSKTNKTFGCSHCYIELENTSDLDFPLDGCYIHFVRNRPNGIPHVSHLQLKGKIPAGGTFLIRGKQLSSFDNPNTFIKVKTFDQEWYENGELIDFSHNGEIINKGTQEKPSYEGNDPHGFALTYGKEDLTYNTQLCFNNSDSDTKNKAPYKYIPEYIDSLYYNNYYGESNAYWVGGKQVMNYMNTTDMTFPDCIYKNTFELDPAKQAYQSLNKYESSRIRHQTANDYQYLYLGKEFIEFERTDEKYPISKFTPKASFEHKNVCTDKSQLNISKPNMVTCSFGKNPYTTRCFNWVSGGLFDEYVWIKINNEWKKFESYKDNSETDQTVYPHRKNFSEDIINCVYKRMTGKFPAALTSYTSHKCIIDIVQNPVTSPTTYSYIVGREDKNGNPDLNHCSEEYTFTLYPNSYTPRIYQVTDQQGFHWVEYQAWAQAAQYINKKINQDLNENIIPILVNTGDMTQSGARINEWLDYYNAGKELFNHLEQVNVVGNNDLCGTNFNILGTGDDEGKSNAYYFHIFYCYEIETEEGKIPIVNNKYVPSLYNIDFDQYKLLCVNSEITEVNCRDWFNLKDSDDNTINIYTGWNISKDANNENKYFNSFTSIYTMIYNMTNTDKEIIAICHEMPFTVITEDNLAPTKSSEWRSQSGASSLVGSHLNQLTTADKVGTHWFSRLLEYRNCKLCIGGHKHTYAVTYPLMENYIYGNKNSKDDGPMNMNSTLEDDNQVSWIKDNKNLSKFPLTLRQKPEGEDPTLVFYPSEFVSEFKNGKKGVIYFMCQATGFKLLSNKELPSPSQTFSQFLPKSDIKRDGENNIIDSKANNDQRSPMFAIIELPSSHKLNIKLLKLDNIQSAPNKLFTQINYGKGDIELKSLVPSNSSEIPSGTQVTWNYGYWLNGEHYLITNI